MTTVDGRLLAWEDTDRRRVIEAIRDLFVVPVPHENVGVPEGRPQTTLGESRCDVQLSSADQ